MLRTHPGFTTVAVLTLALGIGANTAIFSLINALLLKSLPEVKDPEQLVLVTDNGWASLGYPLYEHLRDESQSLSGLFASSGVSKRRLKVTGSGDVKAEPVWHQPVSGNFFSILGVQAVLGRTLTPNDDRPGEPQPVAVISYDFWRRRFGCDPAVVGRTITLEDIPLTIVGVAPRRFLGFIVGSQPDLWWPIGMYPQVQGWKDALTSESSQWLQIVGRLKPGATQARAQDELDVVFKRMRLAQAENWHRSEKERQDFLSHRIELQSAGTGFTWLRRDFLRLLFILMGIVGLVLLVAMNLPITTPGARVNGSPAALRRSLCPGPSACGGEPVARHCGGVLACCWAMGSAAVGQLSRICQSVLLLTPDLKILVLRFCPVGTAFGLLLALRTTRPDLVNA
jgi:hypothetical protein